ncbi:MAG: Hsp20/alpha crystallin family protein [Lentisphaeria bacterium]|jgi:HSP20 family protein|nr:Hsp20/alpha crystallin family protein [Lentisphaeria bacterium]
MADSTLTKREKQTPATAERASDTPVFVPRFDIVENETQVLLVGDMPGVDEASVQIDLDGSELTIRGSYVPKAPEGYTLNFQEYTSGDYERSFTLGNTIDRTGIKAVVKDGVLRLTLPKAKEAQPRRITVKAG